MSSLRALIRERIPLSRETFELVQHRRRRRKSLPQIAMVQESPGPIKLDLGGGYRKGSNGWLTVDTSFECDLYWDLREGIPFADDSIDSIYSSHLLEHLSFSDQQKLLHECFRVLKPQGSISIVVPNARMYIEGYMGLRDIPLEYFGWKPALNDTTAIDAVNYVAYLGGEHKYMFDQENLLHVLTLAGFSDVAERAFDPDTDLIERDFESIYAIGYKPNA